MKKLLSISALLAIMIPMTAQSATFTFTDDADWDLGMYSSTNSGPPGVDDQLQLNPNILTPHHHIWVALSGRDGVVRINTDHEDADGHVTLTDSANGAGAVYGEYLSRPNNMGGNPSRTTVDQNGDVWVGNRAQISGGGSIVKISATPDGTTSTGEWNGVTFNRLDWSNTGNVDSSGGTSTATDSAISQYVRTAGTGIRTVAVDANNNVWAGGLSNHVHSLYDGDTGAQIGTSETMNPGGYGGLIDGNGILWTSGWSTSTIGRYDPVTDTLTHVAAGGKSYGLGIDNDGNIWNSHYDQGTISKINSAGVLQGTWTTQGNLSRGVAVTADNSVWVANSGTDNVTRLDNNGTIIAKITVGDYPTGVSVDSNGKGWVTNRYSNSVMRIDAETNMVDLTVELGSEALPYNYSDMTGTVVTGTTNPTGSWRYIQDGGWADIDWNQIFWDGSIPDGAGLTIRARSGNSMTELNTSAYTTYNLSGELLGLSGQYLEVGAIFTRTGNGDSSILYDLSFTSFDNNPVPEPSTVLLFGVGLAGLVATGMKKRKE